MSICVHPWFKSGSTNSNVGCVQVLRRRTDLLRIKVSGASDMDVTAKGMPVNLHNLFENSDLRAFRLLHPKERLDGTAEPPKPFRKQRLCGDIHLFYHDAENGGTSSLGVTVMLRTKDERWPDPCGAR